MDIAQVGVTHPKTAAAAEAGANAKQQPPITIRSASDVSSLIDGSIDHADPAARRRARRKTLLVMVIALGGVFVYA